MKEQWKDIDGFNGMYQVSNTFKVNKVFGFKSGMMKLQKHKDGYKQIQFRYQGKKLYFLVHRLMMIAFKGQPPFSNSEVLHIDGDKSNNSLSNLRWGTHKENMEDKIKHGSNKGTIKHIGSGNPAAKLNELDIANMRNMYDSGITQRLLGVKFGISQAHVSLIIRRKQWRHVA